MIFSKLGEKIMDEATRFRLLVNHLQSLAVGIAQEAGSFIIDARTSMGDVQAKKNVHDIVTQVDVDVQDFIIKTIRAARPDDGILAEEKDASIESKNGIKWIIDPIDGTRNFAKGGLGVFAVSIGIEIHGVPTIGVVLDVQNDLLYKAANGLGAYRNEKRLQVAKDTDFRTMTVGFDGAMDFSTKNHQMKILTELWPNVGDIRRQGCTSLNYCRVADGTFDAAFNHGNGPWDIAAGRVIAQEAGAKVGNLPLSRRLDTGNSLHEANLVAAPAVFTDLKRAISRAGSYAR